VGRLARGDEQNLVEIELRCRLLGEDQVPDVRGVERAPENADLADEPSPLSS
jgi:hypothetical protein